MMIGITHTITNPVAFENYCSWIRRWVSPVELHTLSHLLNNVGDIRKVDGLVMTGGGDVDPQLYDREDGIHIAQEVDEARDRFELELIDRALYRGIPLLGICRGAQLINVSRGGSLLLDVEANGYSSHRKLASGDRRHAVHVDPTSRLHEIVGAMEGEVNSSHHQAIDTPGEGLRVVARSAEGVVEALEWERPAQRPFLLLVQWHPERMQDVENSFARNVIQRFAHEVQRFTLKKEHA